ncbi:hypothetical protein J6590_077315 [Homalodisca vitripennis]|nr:hypothetical protein J6590_077315 [Homalodisca vitripennis]
MEETMCVNRLQLLNCLPGMDGAVQLTAPLRHHDLAVATCGLSSVVRFLKKIGNERFTQVTLADDVVLNNGRELFKSRHNQWKMQQLERERQRSMYNSLELKKVIKENGVIEWYGCRRDTQRCFGSIVDETPDYLWEGKWTPPCCLAGLRQTARHVLEQLEEARVRYWLEGGSLLGAMRGGDILPWDYDIDIGIYREDITRCTWLLRATDKPITDLFIYDGYSSKVKVLEHIGLEPGLNMRLALKRLDTQRIRKADKAATDIEKNQAIKDFSQKEAGGSVSRSRGSRQPFLQCRPSLNQGMSPKYATFLLFLDLPKLVTSLYSELKATMKEKLVEADWLDNKTRNQVEMKLNFMSIQLPKMFDESFLNTSLEQVIQ